MPDTWMLLTVPLSVLTAMALLVLNALVKLAEAVPPFLAAAAPVPSADSRPLLLRLSPALLSLFWSLLLRVRVLESVRVNELSLESVLVRVLLSVLLVVLLVVLVLVLLSLRFNESVAVG